MVLSRLKDLKTDTFSLSKQQMNRTMKGASEKERRFQKIMCEIAHLLGQSKYSIDRRKHRHIMRDYGSMYKVCLI